MATILLIRHGENDFVGKRLAGRLPGVHLNERGRQQAEALVGLLAPLPIHAIYSSPLERTLETAAPLAAARQLTVQVEPALIELDLGQWQGKTLKSLRRLKLWQVVRQHPAGARFPGGESFAEAQERICVFLDELARLYPEPQQVAACFTHGDMVKLAVAHSLAMPLDAFQRLNALTAAVTVLVLGQGGPALLHYNQLPTLGWYAPPPPARP